ncbi:hypothetical protein [uncultured Maribacter sp.]|uniref:hypothetical protein n=1 Tax=uncultured Maribacter sp. TaxID=431308 RepID=UPI002618D3C2|nr:hypothetical protein [uncultured Maribacter sp.]
MLEHYISCYFNKNLKSATVNFLNSSTENVYEPFKPYDWVLGKDGKYVWDEEVTSKYDTDLNGREYIGKTLKKVENHFIKNNSWFSRYTGSKKGGFLSYTDLNSYYTPRVNMVVQDVFNRHKWKHNLVKNKSNRLNNGRFDKTNVNNDFNILVKGSNQSIEGAVCLDGHEYSYNAVINTSAISSKQLYITDYFYTHNRKGSMLAIGNTGNDLLGNYFSVSNKFVHSDIPVISVHFDNIDEMKKVESWYLKYLGE